MNNLAVTDRFVNSYKQCPKWHFVVIISMEKFCGCGFCRDIRRRKDERDIDEFI